MSQQRIARVGVVLSVAAVGGIGVLSHRSVVEQSAAADLVAHTHEVIRALERVVSGVGEAESSLRGFALMRDPRFLSGFDKGIATAEEGLSSAVAATADNPQQQRLVESIVPVLRERVGLLRERLVAARGGDVRIPAEAVTATERIRSAVSQAVANEQDLLRQRREVARQRGGRARLGVALGAVAAAVLVACAFLLLDREMRRRRQVQEAREHELGLLLELGDLLQACRSADEAFDVVARMGPSFLRGFDGAVSVTQPSRSAVELRATWGAKAALGQHVFDPEHCWGMRRGQVHVADAAGRAPRCEHLGDSAARAAVCLPLLANGEMLGALHLMGTGPVSRSVQEQAAVFGEQIAASLANLALRERLRDQSIRDPLTGLFNRRYTEETLSRELARSQRERIPLAIVLLDVDHFKKFNDTYGHETGDEVLKQIAATLRGQTRKSDVASRLGGEELLVLMPHTDLEGAAQKADSLRGAVATLAIRAHGKPIDPVTVSIGVSAFPGHGATAEELMRAADGALYRAKHEGRNRVVVAQ